MQLANYMMIKKNLMENLMNFRTQKSLTTLHKIGIFGGIQNNCSIIVLNQQLTGKPEEIYWAR